MPSVAVRMLTDGDTFRPNEVVERILDELRKMVGKMLVADVVQVVVVRIPRHPAVKVRPRQDILKSTSASGNKG